MMWIKRTYRRAVRFYKLWQTIKFLDRQCLGIRMGNASGQFIGYWNCEGDFLTAVETAHARIGKQSTTSKTCIPSTQLSQTANKN